MRDGAARHGAAQDGAARDGAARHGAAQGSILDRFGRLAAAPAGAFIVGFWAFGEAFVLPVVPDVVLYPLVAAAPRQALRLFGAVVVGALVGSALLAAFTTSSGQAARGMLLSLPGIDAAMVADKDAAFSRGEWSAFAGIGPGTPLKVDTVAWVSAGGNPVALAAGVVANRLSRIGPGVAAVAIAGLLSPRFLRRHERAFLVVYAVAWIALYAVLWS